MELAGAFFFTIPGPKMMWQFGELGYDFSIDYCENGTINPIAALIQSRYVGIIFKMQTAKGCMMYSALIKLRKNASYSCLFQATCRTISPMHLNGLELHNEPLTLVVIGNFDVVQQTGSVTFPTAGT